MTSEAPSEAVANEDEDDADFLSSSEPKLAPKHSGPKQPIQPIAEEDEEEEHSLLEPEIRRSPSPRPHAAPVATAEPQGPGARLVIHKMVLVNFKSYAGRQEIGPFHKVYFTLLTA